MLLFEMGAFDSKYVPVMLLAIAYSDNITGDLYDAAKTTLNDNQKLRLNDNKRGINDAMRLRTDAIHNYPWDVHLPGSTYTSIPL